MAQSPRERLDSAKRQLEGWDLADRDREAILELVDAYDEDCLTVPTPDGESPRQANTLYGYIMSVGMYARIMDTHLLDATAEDIAEAAQVMIDGDHEAVKDGGYSKNTVSTKQDSVRLFLRYHADDATAAADDVARFTKESSKVDPTKMLDSDEIEAMRQASPHPRDRALFDFFLFTGQRSEAARSIKLRHVDMAESRYQLNSEADGQKSADEVGNWRPLLGASGSLETWLDYHPDADDPDAYLFTARPDSAHYDPYSNLSSVSAQRVLKNMAEQADVTKPVTPHALRHNFVTLAKSEYDMDGDVIKRLIGHQPGSNVMETTYAHLDDEDYMRKARDSFGIDTGDGERTLTPAKCPTCGEGQPPQAKACSNCGAVFTPDAQAAKKEVDAGLKESYKQTAPSDKETMAKLDALDEILDDPEVKAALLGKLQEG